jgi:hypothetical protein
MKWQFKGPMSTQIAALLFSACRSIKFQTFTRKHFQDTAMDGENFASG